MTPPRITLHEAAERLGVHYMTAYRYVRTGLLPAEREGAQWLIDPIELERLAAQPSPRPRGRARAVAPSRLAGRLVAGDEAGAWAIVESALASGADADEVLVDIVAAAMREIGDGWAAGSLDVSDEHRASVVVQRIVARIGSRFTRRGRKRGTIVLGAPEGEEHAVPCAIISDLLRANRFEVHDLGADTPTASFPIAADHAERLVGVMIGVTTEGREGAAAAAIAALRRAGVTVPLFVGGAAVTDADHARRLGADHWTGGDGRAAVAVVERVLSARPTPTSSSRV
jgi:excisionase family DNA binding protein